MGTRRSPERGFKWPFMSLERNKKANVVLRLLREGYRKTLSTADRLAFDEWIERLLSQHGIDYVRGYVDALKERGSQ